jgi:hypothetical protein
MHALSRAIVLGLASLSGEGQSRMDELSCHFSCVFFIVVVVVVQFNAPQLAATGAK